MKKVFKTFINDINFNYKSIKKVNFLRGKIYMYGINLNEFNKRNNNLIAFTIYKLVSIADKDKNNTYIFTNFRVN